MTYLGVEISSRYEVQDEIQRMKKVVRMLPVHFLRNTIAMWCDSKCEHYYVIDFKKEMEGLSTKIHDIFCEVSGGYNGIVLDFEKEESVMELDPYWKFDFEEMA